MLHQFIFVLLFKFGACQYYYKGITPFTPIDISSYCIVPTPPGGISCTIYQIQGVKLVTTCLYINVLRIIGEYDTVRIICSSSHALDFRYHGIQPTEAIRVEWYKEVLPSTSASISAFGVDVQIRSVESLYQYYSKQFKGNRPNDTLPRHDYPRSGNYIFRGIYKPGIEVNIFIYLEDSGVPSFLRNLQTRIIVQDSQLRLPCIPSHYGNFVQVNFTGKEGESRNVEYTKSTDAFQGLLINGADDAGTQVGIYTCYMKENQASIDGAPLDQLSLDFTTSRDSGVRFGLNTSISSNYGQAIKYYSKEFPDRNIQIEIACKVLELGVPTYLAAIEAENFAMMNLKREFTFPTFVGRSYTAISKNTTGQLTFEIRLNEKFHTRYGGATFCKSGDTMEVEEFAVPFVGDVSKRVFDTDWTKFPRESSDIRIHYELRVVGDENGSGSKEYFAGIELTFECKLIIAIVVKPVIWRSIWKNGSKIEEKVDYNWTGKLEDTSYFTKKLETDLIGIECAGTFYYASFWRDISVSLHVNPGSKPEIAGSTEALILRVGARNQGVTCTATGKPTPKLSWFKGGSQLHAFLTANGSLLHQIDKVESAHGGEYTCRAENVYGTDEKVFKFSVEGDEANYAALIGIGVTVFLITVVGAAIYVKFFRKESVGLTRAEVEEFLAGDRSSTVRNSSVYAHEFAHLTPYDKSFELADNKFQIDTTDVLGTGAYGVVFKGIVDGKPVAVKTTKRNADKAYLKALLSELKIMIYLGYHQNIVQLIGASTKDLEKGTLYIFVPFCGLGNLEKYLRANRHLYEEGAELEYRNLEEGVFNFKDLLEWSTQIAEGMEYLASRKVIHGDLAARNVLLTEKKQARITDFGLSRQLYGYASYVKKHQEPLPWRWMAIESLQDLSFSTLSDIWSYGVLLWELFSLGEVPYPGMSWTLDFVDELGNGLRMSRPKRAPDYLYANILYLCWHKIPTERPSFTKIRETLADFKSLYCTPSAASVEKPEDGNLSDIKIIKGNEYSNM